MQGKTIFQQEKNLEANLSGQVLILITTQGVYWKIITQDSECFSFYSIYIFGHSEAQTQEPRIHELNPLTLSYLWINENSGTVIQIKGHCNKSKNSQKMQVVIDVHKD